MSDTPTCPYCGDQAKLATGQHVYKHRPDLYHLKFWVCDKCDARVGCHNGSDKPFGTLANGPTRLARRQAHFMFDPLWKKGSGKKCFTNRTEAYKWLKETTGVAHIGEATSQECDAVVRAVKGRKK